MFDLPASSRLESEHPPLLAATFEFATDGGLRLFVAHGVLLDQQRNEALVDQLSAHPKWADSDAEVALMSMGGRSADGAVQAAPSEVGLAALARFLGAEPKVLGIRPNWRQDGVSDGPAPFTSAPGWRTGITAKGRDGNVVSYRLDFEPFGGRLTSLVRE